MAWNTVRKEDKPYKFDDENLVLVEYTSNGRLYFTNNRENILVGEDDYLAVSYIPAKEDDARLPVVAVRCLGFTGKHFLDTCKWLGFDPNTTDSEIKPRYHEESVLKNISRDDDSNDGGGAIIISINPSTGEEESASSSGGYQTRPNNSSNDSNNSDDSNNDNEDENNDVNENEESNDSSNNSNSQNNSSSNNSNSNENSSNNSNHSPNNIPGNCHGVNESEQSDYDSFLEELLQEKPQEENEIILDKPKVNSIFTFIKKNH